MMKLKHLLAAAGLLALATLLVAQEPTIRLNGPEPVTVILVRHAEKAPAAPGENDPELSEAGAERARALARLLSKAGVTHVFCTEYERTRATVAPLAAALELEARVVPAREAKEQVALIKALDPGAVALVAGHSNTVPKLVEELGGEVGELVEDPRHGGMLGDDQYDRLFVVTLPGKVAAVKTLELRYGR